MSVIISNADSGAWQLYDPRCSNLDTIHLDRNLVRIGAGKDAQMHLHFPADAVKNEIELEFSLPRSTIDLLDLYLGKFRPKLVRSR
jgi:hypothetical protein